MIIIIIIYQTYVYKRVCVCMYSREYYNNIMMMVLWLIRRCHAQEICNGAKRIKSKKKAKHGHLVVCTYSSSLARLLWILDRRPAIRRIYYIFFRFTLSAVRAARVPVIPIHTCTICYNTHHHHTCPRRFCYVITRGWSPPPPHAPRETLNIYYCILIGRTAVEVRGRGRGK